MLHPWEPQLCRGLAEQPRRERLLCSVTQSCPTLCDCVDCPTLCDCVDCSPPGSSVHGMLQAKVLKWVAISSSRESSRPGSNSRLLHWQADSLSPSHRGSPRMVANLKFVLKTLPYQKGRDFSYTTWLIIRLPWWLKMAQGDPGWIPGSGRSPEEDNDNPLQYSCLENSVDRGTWRAIVHGVTKSQT